MRIVGVLFAVLWIPAAHGAAVEPLEVPLLVDGRHLSVMVALALEMDEHGHARLAQDECNRIDLSDLELETAEGRIGVSLAVDAATGVRVLGRCRGPRAWQGRMVLDLVPQVEASGLAVAFSPRSAQLVRPDGSPGALTPPTRMLAESLILPRVGRVRVDVSGPLTAIDQLIEELLVPGDPDYRPLIQRTRIKRVAIADAGLQAWLAFALRPPGAEPPPEPILDPAELAEWQRLEDELDGFLTTVTAALARHAAMDRLRLDLLAVLLDARHAIAEALVVDDPGIDPVREVFMQSWDRLRPHLAELELADVPGLDVDLRLAGFIAGGDVLRALDGLGPEYGLEITRDGLRRLARLLLVEETPLAFTPLPLEVDAPFRALFRLDPAPPVRTRGLLLVLVDGRERLGGWVLPAAHARAPSPAEALHGLVPRLAFLDEYLDLVATLLGQQSGARLAESTRVPARLKDRFDPMVRATAWKESCWRQFTGSPEEPRVLKSPIGALGMMQINGRVWRGVYDLDRLADEVAYNVAAGIEILEHYLVDYAIRRGEHELRGGDDNLIKATYAAYNGGPSHLSRYRRGDTAPRLKAIDKEFWRHYTTIKSERRPDVASCYPVGG